MGTLYREVVSYKRQRVIKFLQFLILIILILDTAFLLSSFKSLIVGLTYVGYAIIPIAAFLTAYLYLKSKIKYRYAIIDNELIIERLSNEKRKVVLNLNVKNIIKIEKASKVTNEDNVEKEYKFSCTGCKDNTYRCVFKKDGKLYSFYFDPSNEMINKINMIKGHSN